MNEWMNEWTKVMRESEREKLKNDCVSIEIISFVIVIYGTWEESLSFIMLLNFKSKTHVIKDSYLPCKYHK